ncbi:MAG: BlaI/MecI/CopY family transcriptional regulator, partial [Clostridia bacterium]|nr:BlaI/MecI/CopY family transcriptional regulator [Clostridia bacterium]
DLIWQNEPISSAELARQSEDMFKWKKSTTYTVLKRLCDKGIFQNVKGIVTSLISKQELFAMQSESFVEDTFDGSLPAFVAAFTTRKRLSAEEIAHLRRIIDEHEEE